jgi:hypothetical protein
MATRRYSAAPALKPETIAVLLAGWGVEAPEPGPHGFGGGVLELFLPDVGPARLWRQHEAYLRSVAARWNWAPTIEAPNGRKLFWGEAVALGLVRER